MNPLRVASLAFIASFVLLLSSYVSNELISPPGNPGVERPVVAEDVLVYTFEASALVLAAIGVTALVVSQPTAWRWLSSWLAVVFAWMAAVFFMFVTLGRQEQYEIYQAGREDLLLMGRLPGWEGFYSAGFLFFGLSVILFSSSVLRLNFVHRVFGVAGVVLGALLVAASYVRLVRGRDGMPDDFLAPFFLLMLWLLILGLMLLRSSRRVRESSPIAEGPFEHSN